MHAFLAAGFLTKNAVAWMVPALALVAFVVWERRWRELVAWELLAPLAVQVGGDRCPGWRPSPRAPRGRSS